MKLPKIPELKSWEGDKSLGFVVDFQNYAYKDKQRETIGQQALQERESNTQPRLADLKQKRRAWSEKLDQQEIREKRREKKRTRRERERWERMTPAEREDQRKLEAMIEQVKRRRLEDDQVEFNESD